MLKELHIESNIPIIFLTIVIICMIIYGYLEIKKINHRFDSLNSKMESIIQKNEQREEQNQPSSIENTMEEIINQEESKQEEAVYEEEAQELLTSYNNTSDDIHSETSEEMGWSAENDGKIIDLNVSPEENFKELIIQKINNGTYDEDKAEIEEISEEDSCSQTSEDSTKEIDPEAVSILNMETENYEDEMNSGEMNLGEMNLGEMNLSEVESENGQSTSEVGMVVDDKLSVSQLRDICKELKLPQSGNKSKLIQRIRENQ